MVFKPVILWTDALIYLLVVVIIGFVIYARGKEPLRAPWRQVGRSRLAMASLVVLLAYVAVGLMDSFHFQKALDSGTPGTEVHYSPEVTSVLDVILQPLRDHADDVADQDTDQAEQEVVRLKRDLEPVEEVRQRVVHRPIPLLTTARTASGT